MKRPKATPSLPTADMRSTSVRADDWTGPMNRHSSSPHAQKAGAPNRAISVTAKLSVAVNVTINFDFRRHRCPSVGMDCEQIRLYC